MKKPNFHQFSQGFTEKILKFQKVFLDLSNNFRTRKLINKTECNILLFRIGLDSPCGYEIV